MPTRNTDSKIGAEREQSHPVRCVVGVRERLRGDVDEKTVDHFAVHRCLERGHPGSPHRRVAHVVADRKKHQRVGVGAGGGGD